MRKRHSSTVCASAQQKSYFLWLAVLFEKGKQFPKLDIDFFSFVGYAVLLFISIDVSHLLSLYIKVEVQVCCVCVSCALEREVFVATSTPTLLKASQLQQWQVCEMPLHQPAVTLTDLSQELLIYNRNRFTTLRCLHDKYLSSLCFGSWMDFSFCWNVKQTQHKNALVSIIYSHLWVFSAFGMNTNGSNRNDSMKRRLPNSISGNNFIDLFVQTPLSGVSPPDEQGKQNQANSYSESQSLMSKLWSLFPTHLRSSRKTARRGRTSEAASAFRWLHTLCRLVSHICVSSPELFGMSRWEAQPNKFNWKLPLSVCVCQALRCFFFAKVL